MKYNYLFEKSFNKMSINLILIANELAYYIIVKMKLNDALNKR